MTTTVPLPKLPFAVFDEFGQGADDRMLAYGDAREVAARAEMQAKLDALKNQEPVEQRLVSNISGQVTGHFAIGEDVELKSERLEPLYLAAGASPKLVEVDERAEFEAWAFDYGHSIEKHPANTRYYLQDEAEDSWRAWLARAALEGEKP